MYNKLRLSPNRTRGLLLIKVFEKRGIFIIGLATAAILKGYVICKVLAVLWRDWV